MTTVAPNNRQVEPSLLKTLVGMFFVVMLCFVIAAYVVKSKSAQWESVGVAVKDAAIAAVECKKSRSSGVGNLNALCSNAKNLEQLADSRIADLGDEEALRKWHAARNEMHKD